MRLLFDFINILKTLALYVHLKGSILWHLNYIAIKKAFSSHPESKPCLSACFNGTYTTRYT